MKAQNAKNLLLPSKKKDWRCLSPYLLDAILAAFLLKKIYGAARSELPAAKQHPLGNRACVPPTPPHASSHIAKLARPSPPPTSGGSGPGCSKDGAPLVSRAAWPTLKVTQRRPETDEAQRPGHLPRPLSRHPLPVSPRPGPRKARHPRETSHPLPASFRPAALHPLPVPSVHFRCLPAWQV